MLRLVVAMVFSLSSLSAAQPQASDQGQCLCAACKSEDAICLSERAIAKHVEHIQPLLTPPNGKNLRLKGIIRFAIRFGADGRVQCLRLISGHALVVDSGQSALLNWIFRPVVINGTKHGGCGELAIRYKLGLYGNSTRVVMPTKQRGVP